MAVFIKDLSKLSQPMIHDEILNIEYHPVDWQPQPVMEINNNYCYLKNTMTTVRNLFLILWLCAFIVLCGMYTNDFVDGWNKSEWSAINYINNRKEDNGDNYFAITKDEREIFRYNRISKDGVMTLKQYIHDRYHYYVAGERKFHTDIFILIIAIPGLLYWVITFPRYAPLIFDRKRRLVYSWRKGVIAVARYDDLHIYENSTALMFMLRSETKNDAVGWFKFAVQPSGNPIINSKKSYKEILVYVAHFMEHGREHVLPDHESWEAPKGSFFFDDVKPADFESRLIALLERVDDEKMGR